MYSTNDSCLMNIQVICFCKCKCIFAGLCASFFERARALRPFLLGKKAPSDEELSVRLFQGHQGADHGAWRQSLLLPL